MDGKHAVHPRLTTPPESVRLSRQNTIELHAVAAALNSDHATVSAEPSRLDQRPAQVGVRPWGDGLRATGPRPGGKRRVGVQFSGRVPVVIEE